MYFMITLVLIISSCGKQVTHYYREIDEPIPVKKCKHLQEQEEWDDDHDEAWNKKRD